MVPMKLSTVNVFAPGTYEQIGPGIPNEKTPGVGVILLFIEQEYAAIDD